MGIILLTPQNKAKGWMLNCRPGLNGETCSERWVTSPRPHGLALKPTKQPDSRIGLLATLYSDPLPCPHVPCSFLFLGSFPSQSPLVLSLMVAMPVDPRQGPRDGEGNLTQYHF